MEVLNGGDFDQKNVLIGQSGKTQGFGVTNDPILMGILSTGLYKNPMRTMIQEVMFNAWDAHRMGNCQDTPIDIYINDTSGLIVRDYGPGISPDEIHPIYCIYGNSTKRKDDALTGGFGLGSKSPYAYSDSFTVTTYHKATKSMYVMNRVSEENNGGPGMSPIFERIPTDQTGLLVTVPLKNAYDMDRAYQFIKKILVRSSIKANIHYADKSVELIETETVLPGEWDIDEDTSYGALYAVYGGVSYLIERDDAYDAEYTFVKSISKLLGDMYIGFKPSSLTPLPSREGLNLNERTVNTIKNQLEIIEENFREMLIPAARAVFHEAFKSLCKSGIEPKFMVSAWRRAGINKSLLRITDSMHPITAAPKEQCPTGMNQSMWNSLVEIVYKHTGAVTELVGFEKINNIKYILWAKKFPELKHYRRYLTDSQAPTRNYQTISEFEAPVSTKELISAKDICDRATESDNDIRVHVSNKWVVATNVRRGGKPYIHNGISQTQIDNLKALKKDHKVPTIKHLDRLWEKTTGNEYAEVHLTKIVIVAKTLSALKETNWNWQAMFASNYPNVSYHHPFHRSEFNDTYYTNKDKLCAAIIVSQKHGAYDKAIKALTDAGYNVYEADEPKKAVRAVTAQTTRRKPTYPLYDPSTSDWCNWDNEVEDPTCYIYATNHTITTSYSSDLPNKTLMSYVHRNTPRFVVIHNNARAKPLQNKGIPSFQDKLHKLTEELLKNEERIREIYLYHIFKNDSNLPTEMQNLPEVQKLFNISQDQIKQKESFEDEYTVLRLIEKSTYSSWVHRDTQQMVTDRWSLLSQDSSVSLAHETAEKTKLLLNYNLENHMRDMKPIQIKTFAEKFIELLSII